MTYSTTCGHSVQSLDDLFDLQVKDHSPDGIPCITYGVYCPICADRLCSSGSILSSKKDEESWLSSSPIDKSTDQIKQMASELWSHADPLVAKFSRLVYNTLYTVTPIVTINTNDMFTVSLGDHEIRGRQSITFPSVDAAIIALNRARITWVRPFKINLLDTVHEVSENDFDCGNFLIEYCLEAALALLDGNTPYSKHDGEYIVEVVIPT